MRGVPFVQVPTTLLAQVDSSVGGKTAINHPLGKNMIGAFHQPLRGGLRPRHAGHACRARELRAGLAEVIKYGPIADAAFLDWIEANIDALLAREPARAGACGAPLAARSRPRWWARTSARRGLRAILNFGHTFGHAIEAGLGYGAWLHGEAVGCGMVMAADLSRAPRADATPRFVAAHRARWSQRAGLPVAAPDARRRALPRADARRQEGRRRRDPLRGDRGARPRRACAARPTRWCAQVLAALHAADARPPMSARALRLRSARAARGRRHRRAAPRRRAATSSATATASSTAPRSAGWSTRPRSSSTTRATCSARG